MERLNHFESMAKELINQYVPHYKFEWNNTKTILGLCDMRNKVIKLSKHYVSNHKGDSDIKNTILHEIAHALAPRDCNHGRAWKEQCRIVGAIPKATCDKVERVGHTWEAYCLSGCTTVKYFRKPKIERYHCRKCKQKFTLKKVG